MPPGWEKWMLSSETLLFHLSTAKILKVLLVKPLNGKQFCSSCRITQKMRGEWEGRGGSGNHVYEQRFKAFWITSAVSICYVGLSGGRSRPAQPGPARPVMLSILIELFALIGQTAKEAD